MLWAVAAFTLLVLNGAFLYGLIFVPGAMQEAMENPISAAFMFEAAVLVGLLAYLVSRWEVGRLSWKWLVGLSILGGLAFALPAVILWPSKTDEGRDSRVEPVK